MKRTFIDQPLKLDGDSFLGLLARFDIKPYHKPGVWWKVSSGETVNVTDATLGVHKLFHYLTLRWGSEVLRIPEHLFGLLFAIGLDNICLVPHDSRLPYDGCAKTFWEDIQPELCTGGSLKLYTPKKTLRIGTGGERSILFYPDTTTKILTYNVCVNYKGIGVSVLEGSLDTIDIAVLASSRPYGRTKIHKMLSQIVQQKSQCVWFESDDCECTKKLKLEEIATHRLLDMLGALLHMCPPGGRLVGRIVTQPFSGHATDLLLSDAIKETGLKRTA